MLNIHLYLQTQKFPSIELIVQWCMYNPILHRTMFPLLVIVKEMAYKIPGWCFLEIIHEKWAILACWNTIKCTAQKIKMKIFISKEALIYISYNLPKNTPNIFFMLHHSMIFDRKTKGNPKSLTLSLCSIAILTKSLFFHRHFLLPILPYFNHFLLPYSRELLSLKI